MTKPRCILCGEEKESVYLGEHGVDLERDSDTVPVYFSYCKTCDSKREGE